MTRLPLPVMALLVAEPPGLAVVSWSAARQVDGERFRYLEVDRSSPDDQCGMAIPQARAARSANAQELNARSERQRGKKCLWPSAGDPVNGPDPEAGVRGRPDHLRGKPEALRIGSHHRRDELPERRRPWNSGRRPSDSPCREVLLATSQKIRLGPQHPVEDRFHERIIAHSCTPRKHRRQAGWSSR